MATVDDEKFSLPRFTHFLHLNKLNIIEFIIRLFAKTCDN